MEIRDFIGILGRRKWVVIFTVVFALIVVIIGALQTPPKYSAMTQIRVLTTRTGGAAYVDYNVQYAERLVATYVKIATSTPVLEELSKYVDIPAEKILPMVKADVITNTELFQVSVEANDAGLAQYMTNKIAQIIISQSKQLYSDETSPVTIYVVEPASLPENPSSPSPYLIIALGFLASLVGGLGLALFFENLDTRIYTSSQIESVSQMKVIGDIPEAKGYKDEEELMITDSRLHTESFRRLRTNVFFPRYQEQNLKTLLITSAVGQDGKTSITANLGLSIAQTDRRVLLVDANLRWPKLHEIFGVQNTKGLSDLLDLSLDDILKRGISLNDYISPTKYPGLSVISSGPIPANPVELLGSTRTRVIFDHLKKHFDVLLIDSPACLTVTDPVVLSTRIEGVLLIVRHGWVRREVLLNSIRQLQDANANIIGVVANRTAMGTGSKLSKTK